MEQDGNYHVAGVADGQPVRVSEDFYIEARKANPPQVAMVRPGRGDYHASPIEEVTVAAKATGEYGLQGVTLHYSVNGGPETTVDVLPHKGAKQADGSTTLSLEEFKLVPGDLVSVYATAKDANAEAHTDMIFIQADPFEREFSQSQTGGGGGGGGGGEGNQSAQISQREKEIISSTFRQQADKNSTAQQAAEVAKLLAQSQATLRDQAVKLSDRLQARELTDEVQAIGEFEKDMMAASEAMGPAAQQLQQEKWKDAIPHEQKALQYLLRAEATFRQIQVAFGARGGGGGGGGGAARDLAALFDLELDTEKNQYETRQSAPTSRGTKGPGDRRHSEEARRTGQASGRSGPAAAQRHADCRAEMAAGDAAARDPAAPAADGAATGPAKPAGAAGPTRAARATGPAGATGPTRAARPTRAAGKPERVGFRSIRRTGRPARRAIRQLLRQHQRRRPIGRG